MLITTLLLAMARWRSLCSRISDVSSTDCLHHIPVGFCMTQVASWSSCAGEGAWGHSSRAISCLGPGGAQADASLCTTPAPAASAVCLRTPSSGAATCSPAFVPAWKFGGQDCYSHGSCTMHGCSCNAGWKGQFCEVAAICAGVVDKKGACCNSGMVAMDGRCCAAGAVLDGQGHCCKGTVDVCGVCQGTAWTVDVQVKSH